MPIPWEINKKKKLRQTFNLWISSRETSLSYLYLDEINFNEFKQGRSLRDYPEYRVRALETTVGEKHGMITEEKCVRLIAHVQHRPTSSSNSLRDAKRFLLNFEKNCRKISYIIKHC